MKFIKGIALLFITSLTILACKNDEKTEKTEIAQEKTMAADAKMETASLDIDGMTCEMGCAATIESKLSALDGVKDAHVDFEGKTATVSFDANKQNLASLTETIEKTGGGDTYKVTESKIVTQ